MSKSFVMLKWNALADLVVKQSDAQFFLSFKAYKVKRKSKAKQRQCAVCFQPVHGCLLTTKML